MNEAGGKGNSRGPKGHSVAFVDKDLYEAFLRLEKEDKIATLERSLIIKAIGKANSATMENVKDELLRLF